MNQPLLNTNIENVWGKKKKRYYKTTTNVVFLDLATSVSKAEGVQWKRTSNYTYYKVVIS